MDAVTFEHDALLSLRTAEQPSAGLLGVEKCPRTPSKPHLRRPEMQESKMNQSEQQSSAAAAHLMIFTSPVTAPPGTKDAIAKGSELLAHRHRSRSRQQNPRRKLRCLARADTVTTATGSPYPAENPCCNSSRPGSSSTKLQPL